MHCIEFPSILLPPGCSQGSVVSISCSRNLEEEQSRNDDFWSLQDDILASFGERSPSPPSLRLRNVTQTSVTLEWDKLDLVTSKLLNLTIWRNGQRLAAIPNPLNNTSTKLSGLDVDANYSFLLVMRTSAGTFSSQTIKTRTLTLTDTSGVAVCFGLVEPPELLDEAKQALDKMKARWSNRIQIETTHFVCTQASTGLPESASAGTSDEPNPVVEFQRALQLSIPVVQPSWVLSCLREKKMVSISQHQLEKKSVTSAAQSKSASLTRASSSRSQPLGTTTSAQQSATHTSLAGKQQKQAPIQLQQPPLPRNVVTESIERHAASLSQEQPEAEKAEPEAIIPPADEHGQKLDNGQPGESEVPLSIRPTPLPEETTESAESGKDAREGAEVKGEAAGATMNGDNEDIKLYEDIKL